LREKEIEMCESITVQIENEDSYNPSAYRRGKVHSNQTTLACIISPKSYLKGSYNRRLQLKPVTTR
jgi:hypothetical protein